MLQHTAGANWHRRLIAWIYITIANKLRKFWEINYVGTWNKLNVVCFFSLTKYNVCVQTVLKSNLYINNIFPSFPDDVRYAKLKQNIHSTINTDPNHILRRGITFLPYLRSINVIYIDFLIIFKCSFISTSSQKCFHFRSFVKLLY